jgi:hypothetical protein
VHYIPGYRCENVRCVALRTKRPLHSGWRPSKEGFVICRIEGCATVRFEVGSWKPWGSAKRLITAQALCKWRTEVTAVSVLV